MRSIRYRRGTRRYRHSANTSIKINYNYHTDDFDLYVSATKYRRYYGKIIETKDIEVTVTGDMYL